LIDDGELARHVRRNRRVYAARREVLVDALGSELGDRVRFRLPTGGMALWLQADTSLDVERWSERCLRRGVLFSPGQRFHFHGTDKHHLRIGFARATEGELRWAMQVLRRSLV